jgi:DoxX-like protein
METTASTAGIRSDHAAAAARVATWLVVAQLTLSGALLLARPELVTTVIRHLGYPDYFPVILGTAKLLGALAIAHPRHRTLAEWAYAGATFDVLAVVASHAAIGDPIHETIVPLVVLVPLAVSYTQRRAHEEEP